MARYGQRDKDMSIAILIFFAGVVLYFLWIKIINPLILWIKANILLFKIFGILVFIGLVIYLFFYLKKRKKQKKEKEIYEEKQRKKGLSKFIDSFGAERWGTKKQIKEWRDTDDKEMEKKKLVNQIYEKIREFQPFKDYSNEFSYQFELGGYLKAIFPNTKIEQQRGSSRPDIIISNVAIEVKGPTSHRDLDSVWSKCGRYYKHFEELIVVLFDVLVNERYYKEWEESLQEHFPNVKIIRKD